MIRRINKIVALMLIGTSIGTVVPKGIFDQRVNAAEITESKLTATDESKSGIDINSETNIITMASSEEELIAAAIMAAESAGESGKLSAMNSIIKLNISGGTQSVTLSSTPIGSLSYKLTQDKVKEIENVILAKMGSTEGQALTQTLISLATNPIYAAYKNDALIVLGILSELKTTGDKAEAGDLAAEAELITEIQTLASSVPMYQYTGVSASGISSQGFTAGGLIGLMTAPDETYNATVKNATYSTSDVVPVLDLSSEGTFKKVIDLSDSNYKVICDGINVNIVDSQNNKLYSINNPVYNMFKVSAGGSASTDLNSISFPEDVTNLKGSSAKVKLTSEGIDETTILSLSLSAETSNGKSTKNYKYVTALDETEKSMVDSMIDGLNLSATISDLIKAKVQANTFVMIPNLASSIGDTIGGITDSVDDLSDALNDLTDSLNDKSDDVDDAWDKVFDRFDNDEGWGKKDGYIYYYDEDGVSLKGVQKIDGKTYYFNRIDGAMEKEWQIVDGKRCYFDKKKGYQLFNQWIQDNDDRYFLDEKGEVKKMKWVNIGGKDYYLKADGKMTRDWLKIDDYWYFFNKDGSMATSTWKWSDGKWYYLKNNGQAANDWLQLGNEWYYFKDPSGEMQTGWFRANGSWYCANDDGSMKTGWVDSEDGRCYLDDTDGKMKKNEWVIVDNKKYYFNVNGIMVTGSRYIDGTKYIFNSDGSLG